MAEIPSRTRHAAREWAATLHSVMWDEAGVNSSTSFATAAQVSLPVFGADPSQGSRADAAPGVRHGGAEET